jgi:hypothetical protein
MHHNNRLLIDCSDGGNKSIAVVPGVKVVTVTYVRLNCDVALARIGVDANDGELGVLGCCSALLSVVVGRGGDGCTIFLSLSLDGVQRGD